jgi:hypothetical protein
MAGQRVNPGRSSGRRIVRLAKSPIGQLHSTVAALGARRDELKEPMRTIKHPLSGAVYDLDVDGTIQVVAPDGRRGVFDARGVWISGDVKQADPHLCLWIGGKELPSRVRQAADAPENEGSIPDEELTR